MPVGGTARDKEIDNIQSEDKCCKEKESPGRRPRAKVEVSGGGRLYREDLPMWRQRNRVLSDTEAHVQRP